MSTSSENLRLSQNSDSFESPQIQESSEGHLGGKQVEKADAQCSKDWYLAAAIIGTLIVVAGGAFTTVGLLQTHHFMSLPSQLHFITSAIGTIGHTPGNWSLWSIGLTSALVGTALSSYGFYKLHKIQQKQAQQHAEAKKIQQDAEDEKLFNENFTDNLSVINRSAQPYNLLDANTYLCVQIDEERVAAIVHGTDSQGSHWIFCTHPSSQENFVKITDVLKRHEIKLSAKTEQEVLEEYKQREDDRIDYENNLLGLLGKNFGLAGIRNINRLPNLSANQYVSLEFGTWSRDGEQFIPDQADERFIVVLLEQKSQNNLEPCCTRRISKDQNDELLQLLRTKEQFTEKVYDNMPIFQGYRIVHSIN